MPTRFGGAPKARWLRLGFLTHKGLVNFLVAAAATTPGSTEAQGDTMLAIGSISSCSLLRLVHVIGVLLAGGVEPAIAQCSASRSALITFSAADLCLPDADGYTVSFTAGAYDYEIGWSLLDPDGAVAMSGGAPGEYTTCPPVENPCNTHDFHMTDAYGDGWNCAAADISDCDGNVLATGIAPPNVEGEDCTSWTIHDAGTFSEADLCLPDADGYVISFNSSPYDGEIGWSLIDADGNVALSGGAPGTYDTCPTADCDAANSWDFHMTDTYGRLCHR